MSNCKSSFGPCGLCKANQGICWYDKCRDCDEIRIEHRYGFVGCGANIEQFVKRDD